MSQYPSAANYLPSSPSSATTTSSSASTSAYNNIGHPHHHDSTSRGGSNTNPINNNNANSYYSSSAPPATNNQQIVYPGYPGASIGVTSVPSTSGYPGFSNNNAATTSYNYPISNNNNNNNTSYNVTNTNNNTNSYYQSLPPTSSNAMPSIATPTTSGGTSYPSASSYLGIDTTTPTTKNNKKKNSTSSNATSTTSTAIYTTPGGPVNYPSGANYSADTAYSMLGGMEPSATSPSKKNSTSSSTNILQTQQQQQIPSPSSSSQRPSAQKPSSPNRSAPSMHNPVHCPYVTSTNYEQGTVRALFVGINYRGQDCELEGCVADVQRQLKTLERLGFPIDECVILTDDPKFPRNGGMPTKKNMLYWMHWLVSDAQPGDTFFFHVSSHGVSKKQPRDTPPEEREASGTDQYLVPVDHAVAGLIRDDDVFDILVRPLPPGSRLTCVYDLCNSGSVGDLPYEFVANRGDKEYYSTHDSSSAFQKVNNKKHGGGDCVALSACADGTTAADVSNLGPVSKDNPYRGGGAMTYALSEILTKTAGLSFGEVLMETRQSLRKKKFSQVPQMSCTRPIHLTKPFSLFGSLERVSVANYQPPVWTPPSNRISSRSFAFPTLNQTEWTPPSSDYNVSNNMYPSANSVLKSSGGTTTSVYSNMA